MFETILAQTRGGHDNLGYRLAAWARQPAFRGSLNLESD